MRQIISTKSELTFAKSGHQKMRKDETKTAVDRIEACREILSRVKDKDLDPVMTIELKEQRTQVQQKIRTPLSPSNSNQSESSKLDQTIKKEDRIYKSDLTLEDLDVIKTIGTGTFGRVILTQERRTNEYGALKVLALVDIIRMKQIDHVKNEKNILKQVQHPFIVNIKWHYKDKFNLYMLFDFVPGGELFSYLRTAGHFTSSASAFYAAEIICALEYLHSKNIVYRDLKPENLLLDKEGHLKMTDFGFAKQLTDRTWTLCGTPEYLAPEVIQSKGHNKAVDWWALGILIYEMLNGHPPFFDDHAFSTYEKILAGKLEWPKVIDAVAKDIIKKFLVLDRTKRLGSMKGGVEDIKRHRWFKDMDWTDVFQRRLRPPIVPRVTFEGDTNNFDDYPEYETWGITSVSPKELELFKDF